MALLYKCFNLLADMKAGSTESVLQSGMYFFYFENHSILIIVTIVVEFIKFIRKFAGRNIIDITVIGSLS